MHTLPLSAPMSSMLLKAHRAPKGEITDGGLTRSALERRKLAEARLETTEEVDRHGAPRKRFRFYLTPAGHSVARQIIEAVRAAPAPAPVPVPARAVSPAVMARRLRQGWDPERAAATPVGPTLPERSEGAQR
ncbi:hypothetical protein ABT093_19615 [Kitasatospora sp. NPDC002551]|uniref:hypothetical protein n=1 Tax=Kitasatospora sp. NPDC002551 TaxID=3154539 RepID=UPI00331D1594